jgi:hypothetical protein
MLPARDLYHDLVVNALVKDGWTITDDPLRMTWDTVNLFTDLRARRTNDPSDDIAVEIKSFIGRSDVADLEHALGQYLLYRVVASALDLPTTFWLAISEEAYSEIFESGLGQLARLEYGVNLVVIDLENEEVVAWHPS